MKKRFAVIDGDEVLYKVAFSSQFPQFFVSFTDRERQGPFNTEEEAASWVGNDDSNVTEITKDVVGMSTAAVFSKLREAIGQIRSDIDCSDSKVYLTGRGNFRNEVATILPYKGNRSESAKPIHYGLIREMLSEKYEAKEVQGIEADDALSIAGWNSFCDERNWEVVIATQDKDLNMVPGLHYNPRKRELTHFTPEQSRMSFYSQLLTGDPVDNIPGIRGMGKVTAAKVIQTLAGQNHERIMNVIKEKYYKEAEKLKLETDPLNKITEVGTLLWMLQALEQRWEVGNDYYEGYY